MPPSLRWDAAALVVHLNLAETREWTGAHYLGGWCQAREGDVSFMSFLPAAVYEPGLIALFLRDAVRRAEWLSRRLRG